MNAAQAANSGAAIPENPASGEAHFPARATGFDYFRQVLPETTGICGRALLPLSIGRYRRMRRQNICYVSDEPVTDHSTMAGDLLKAVVICSMTCADYDSFIQTPDAGRQIKKWATKQGFLPPRYVQWPIIGGVLVKLVGKQVAWERAQREAAYIIEQIEIFKEYIAEAQRIPNYTMRGNSPGTNPLHWSNNIELHLRAELGWTNEEINEGPLSKALADYFGHAIQCGHIRLLTDADLVQADDNAKALEALLKQIEAANKSEVPRAESPTLDVGHQTPDPI